MLKDFIKDFVKDFHKEITSGYNGVIALVLML